MRNRLIEIVYYSSVVRNLFLLRAQENLKKNFILFNVNKFPFNDYKIMIEIDQLDDYLDDDSIDFCITKRLRISSKVIYNKRNKFNMLLKIKNNNFFLKAFKPIWGTMNKNNLWLAFVSKTQLWLWLAKSNNYYHGNDHIAWSNYRIEK